MGVFYRQGGGDVQGGLTAWFHCWAEKVCWEKNEIFAGGGAEGLGTPRFLRSRFSSPQIAFQSQTAGLTVGPAQNEVGPMVGSEMQRMLARAAAPSSPGPGEMPLVLNDSSRGDETPAPWASNPSFFHVIPPSGNTR